MLSVERHDPPDGCFNLAASDIWVFLVSMDDEDGAVDGMPGIGVGDAYRDPDAEQLWADGRPPLSVLRLDP